MKKIKILLLALVLTLGTHEYVNVLANNLNENYNLEATQESNEENQEDEEALSEIEQTLPPVEEATQEIEESETQTQEAQTEETPTEEYQLTTRGYVATRSAAFTEDTSLINTTQSASKSGAGLTELIVTKDAQPYSIDNSEFTSVDGKIVKMESGLFYTLGGAETLVPFYQSLEDAINQTNQIPISGGAYDGLYLETIEADGNYYASVIISGLEGYVNISNIQLLPANYINARSYYTLENNEWLLYEAVDPLTSNEYNVYPMGETPEWASAGEKYISVQDGYYQSLTTGAVKSYRGYYQHLPLRSSSSYTAADYQRYLQNIGKTNSQYYNATSGFIAGANLRGVNSLMLFSMANHESAYGTSYYARTCNNFYGRGAFDSNPDQACSIVGYSQAYDGAAAQAFFLTNEFGDPLDWRYNGTSLGNKSFGMNVYYASDPNWGSKIAGHMESVDAFLGSKEANKFSLVTVPATYIYKNANLNEKYRIVGSPTSETDYYQSANSGANVVMVATGKTQSGYQVQLDVPINTGATRHIGFVSAARGSFPNYEGGVAGNTVRNGVASCLNDFPGYRNNIGYIGNQAVIMNHSNFVFPGEEQQINLDAVNSNLVYGVKLNNGNTNTVGNNTIIGDYTTPITELGIKSTWARDLTFRCHYASQGWTSITNQGNVSKGNNNQLEAIQIELSPQEQEKYEILYRVYIPGQGWLGWAQDGDIAGSIGYGYPITAVQIYLAGKGSKGTGDAFIAKQVYYQMNNAMTGWGDFYAIDDTSEKKMASQLEAIRVFKPKNFDGNVQYNVYIKNKGWQGVKQNSEVAGTVGKSQAITAVCFNSDANLLGNKDIYYTTSSSQSGWTGWGEKGQVNGSFAPDDYLNTITFKTVDRASGMNYLQNSLQFGRMLNVKVNQKSIGTQTGYDHYDVGTTGKNKGLTTFAVSSNVPGVGLQYQVYEKGRGWQSVKFNGENAGGNSTITGIAIALNGPNRDNYDLTYQVHVQNRGWITPVTNGNVTGGIHQNYNIEAIRIKIVPKQANIFNRPVIKKEE